MRLPFARFIDIKAIIIVFFVMRLYGITNPPIEATHSWRQCLTNMEARNFLEEDNNIFYPRIDMNGEKPGVIAGEFPLFNYIIYLCSLLFGYTHWLGRLINLLVSTVGIFYFYKLIKEHFDSKIAYNSTLILLVSLWFSFSRKIMPDTFSVSLVIIGIYYGMNFLYKEGRLVTAVLYFVFCCAGGLSKIPSMALMSVFAIPLLSHDVTKRKKLWILFFSVLILIPVGWWYLIWSKRLFDEYRYQLYYYAETMSEGFNQLVFEYGGRTLSVFYFNALCGFIASLFFLTGMVIVVTEKNKKLLLLSACVLPFLFLFMIKTGSAFSTHNYYVLPFVPFMALIAGYAVSKIKNPKIVVAILVFICLEGILNQQHDFRKAQSDMYKIKLENVADQVSDRGDLIAINGEGSPQQIYLLHRKGWNLSVLDVVNKNTIDSLIGKGCSFLFVNKRTLKANLNSIEYNSVYEDEDFKVFKLKDNGKNN